MESQIRAGHTDLQGLCLALAGWSAELRLLRVSRGLATGGARLAHVRSDGHRLACGPRPLTGAFRRESRPEAEKPASGKYRWRARKEG